ncbi:MAG: glycosyltransferase [Magnetococcales bacterium]|nr:glycosyltransferase [Magnetococcales bacterium]MBF0321822.1 glycosyltransferase [Magnetococcales bacterium]
MFFRKTNKSILKHVAPQAPARFSFIVTGWGEKPSLLRKALNSVADQLGTEGELIVVINQYEDDPGHTEKLVTVVENTVGVTRWCRISQNSGVARAWNVGYQLSEGDLFFIMNGDCVLKKGAVTALLKGFASPKVGIVGVGGIRDGRKVDTPGPCQGVHGFLFGVRRKTHQKIGEFDIVFSPLADEVEYCVRASKAGWEIYIADGVGFNHTCTISEQTDRDIRHFGRLLDRAILDRANLAYKISLPWMEGRASLKIQE